MAHYSIVFTEKRPILALWIDVRDPFLATCQWALILNFHSDEPLYVVFEFILVFIIHADKVCVEDFCLFPLLKSHLVHNLHYWQFFSFCLVRELQHVLLLLLLFGYLRLRPIIVLLIDLQARFLRGLELRVFVFGGGATASRLRLDIY